MWKLVIEDDEGKRTVVPLSREEYAVGRKEGNTIRLTERNVSRSHVALKRGKNGGERETYLIRDLASYNGVFVNGLRVADEQFLEHGDLVQIGDYRILFQDEYFNEQAQPQVTQPDVKQTAQMPAYRGSLLMERPNRLVMLIGPTPGLEYPLDRDRMTIGRAEDASISINHNSVSRLHCEVHLLGEARYEIVDKGSSNGVRVNGAELRRGIIEAGDTIELGDVRFKFVGAGQVFVPGPNESQQLTAISDREAADLHPPKRGGVAVFAVLGAVVAVLAVGALYMYRVRAQQQTDVTPVGSTQPSQLDYESSALAEAKKLCTKDDCEAGHVKATSELREDSPLRASADFKWIESTWADATLAKADIEQDVAKRRALLQRVSQTLTVDPAHRKAAADRLQALDDSTSTNPNALPTANANADAGSIAIAVVDPTPPPPSSATTGTRPPVTHPPATHPPAPPTTPPPPQPSTPPAPRASDFDRASAAALAGDFGRVKAILVPKVRSGTASPDEARLLNKVCHQTKDSTCM